MEHVDELTVVSIYDFDGDLTKRLWRIRGKDGEIFT